MTIIRRPSPFGELVSLRQAMDRLFEDSFVRSTRPWSTSDGIMPLDVRTAPDELVIEAALPGVKPDDVEITLEQGTLTIRARTSEERREEAGDYLVQEIRRGESTRTVTLPSGLEPDKTTARFEDGVLELRIPRAEQVKPRQIRITPGTSGTTTPETTSAPKTAAVEPGSGTGS